MWLLSHNNFTMNLKRNAIGNIIDDIKRGLNRSDMAL